MVQRSLLSARDWLQPTASTNELLAKYATWRSACGASKSTVAAEMSQLRSLDRAAVESFRARTLYDLREKPQEAARVIEASGASLSLATVQTRVRAFERFLMVGVPEGVGRKRIDSFRAALPKGASKGWHDAGLSLPGRRNRTKMPGPTPRPGDIEQILESSVRHSPAAGAVAALTCFSGLDLQAIVGLKWSDLAWRDYGDTPYWEVSCQRRGHLLSCYVVGPGAGAVLRWGLASGLGREACVFPGRTPGSGLSVRAFRDRLHAVCFAAGWPRATRSQLVSALAAWLRERGMDDHSIRLVIGRRRVASVDQLLHRHEQLNAQERIDEKLWTPQS